MSPIAAGLWKNGKCFQVCAFILTKHNNVVGSAMQHDAKIQTLNLGCRRWKEISLLCTRARKQHYISECSAANDRPVSTWWSKLGMTFFGPDRNNPKSVWIHTAAKQMCLHEWGTECGPKSMVFCNGSSCCIWIVSSPFEWTCFSCKVSPIALFHGRSHKWPAELGLKFNQTKTRTKQSAIKQTYIWQEDVRAC